MTDEHEMLPAPAPRRRRKGWRPVADALLPTVLAGSILAAAVGALCLAVDGDFGLGHLPAWLAGVVLGALSLWACARVFLGALRWERDEGEDG